MAKKIGLGMTRIKLLEAVSSNGLNAASTNTYNGSIRVKDFLPLPTLHTAIFPETVNDGDVWLLKKVVIKTVNSIKIGETDVDQEDYFLYPFFVNINNEETWTFSLSSGSVIGEDIEYSVDLECTFEMPLESHRETTRRLVERVSALEKGGGTGTGGSGLELGETEGTAYDGGKGFAVAADVAQLKIDVENLTGNLEGAVSTVNPMLANHESRISALEEGGGGSSSGGGGGLDETALAAYLSENRYVQLEEPLTSIADYLSYYYYVNEGDVIITSSNIGGEVERTLYDMLPSVAENFGYITEGTAYNIAADVVDNSTTIAEIKDRVTALEEAGGSGSSGEGESGGSESSGGTKLYNITGSAFESMTDNGLTFNFRAVVSKDPTLITVFPELFDNFGAVSVMAMPDGSGFYPMGFVQQNGTWKVYGLKDGSVITSTYGIMFGSINTEEL